MDMTWQEFRASMRDEYKALAPKVKARLRAAVENGDTNAVRDLFREIDNARKQREIDAADEAWLLRDQEERAARRHADVEAQHEIDRMGRAIVREIDNARKQREIDAADEAWLLRDQEERAARRHADVEAQHEIDRMGRAIARMARNAEPLPEPPPSAPPLSAVLFPDDGSDYGKID